LLALRAAHDPSTGGSGVEGSHTLNTSADTLHETRGETVGRRARFQSSAAPRRLTPERKWRISPGGVPQEQEPRRGLPALGRHGVAAAGDPRARQGRIGGRVRPRPGRAARIRRSPSCAPRWSGPLARSRCSRSRTPCFGEEPIGLIGPIRGKRQCAQPKLAVVRAICCREEDGGSHQTGVPGDPAGFPQAPPLGYKHAVNRTRSCGGSDVPRGDSTGLRELSKARTIRRDSLA
jgi:hypothetical protein